MSHTVCKNATYSTTNGPECGIDFTVAAGPVHGHGGFVLLAAFVVALIVIAVTTFLVWKHLDQRPALQKARIEKGLTSDRWYLALVLGLLLGTVFAAMAFTS